ncbi:hypothetical protein BgAZ_202180 [Babesia gibsoni]|uniref:Trafficking protein particle complex subunit n=1 Tax=Babesia gibsoni TaxID=33632 RepID=A0AAD8PE54_BABGI|nr:hypothetical protein BgAZ_202180 [Babesia gibsoni]
MPELHSFHIFFRKNCIHRYLHSDAAVTAVKQCTSIVSARERSNYGSQCKEPDSTDPKDSTEEDLTEKYEQYEKLLIGFICGLTSFCKTIHVTNELKRPERLSVAYFNLCATSNFSMHYLETVSGYKLICVTSPDVPSLEMTMNAIYTDLITTMVLSNPLYTIGSIITFPEFDEIVAKTLLANI